MLALRKNEVFANRYLLTYLIGTRGVSEVWVCEDLLENNEEVALKIYTTLDKTDQRFFEQLKLEVIQDQTVQHPHILQTYEFDIFNGSPYVVMPYMAQGSLISKLYDSDALTELEAATLLKQIGSALQYLHNFNPPYLHQHLKPDNILIAGEDDYVLADSNIQNRLKNIIPKVSVPSEHSATAYAPPELFTAVPKAYTASDIFSFGVTLYEMCSGQLPWMGNGGLSLLQGAAVPYLPIAYSRELNKIVIACLDPKWENRPSAAELVEEGTYYIAHGRWKPYGKFSVAKVDVVKYEKNPVKKIVLWAAVILVALSALGYFLYTQTDILKSVIKPIATTSDSTTTETMIVSETSENAGSETEISPSTEPIDVQQAPAPPDTPPVVPATARQAPKQKTVVTKAPVNTPAAKPATQPKRNLKTTRPAYTRPATAEQYLAQIQNKSIPKNVRQQWRKDVWRFFDRNASVNYVVRGELVGILSASELIDLMLDEKNSTVIQIDSTQKNAAGKIDQVFVYVQE